MRTELKAAAWQFRIAFISAGPVVLAVGYTGAGSSGFRRPRSECGPAGGGSPDRQL